MQPYDDGERECSWDRTEPRGGDGHGEVAGEGGNGGGELLGSKGRRASGTSRRYLGAGGDLDSGSGICSALGNERWISFNSRMSLCGIGGVSVRTMQWWKGAH